MDTEQEIWRLYGETMAIQSVLTGLCDALVRSGDGGRALVEHAFGYAETVANASALKLAGEGSQEHLTAFVSIVEQLREAALGGHGQPKGGI